MASTVCKLGMYLRVVSQIVSGILSLVFIALDRFVAIVFPLKAIMIMCVKIWVFLMVFSYGGTHLVCFTLRGVMA